MTKEQYIKVTEPLRRDAKKAKAVIFINKILTGGVFLAYPLYLAVLFLQKDVRLLKAVLVPAVSFLLVSVFRKVKNTPRPYERFDIPPVIEKDTKGKSFPSRHVFSVFVIAATVFVTSPLLGLLLGMIGAVMAVIRVVGGVHEPRDVIAGALVGILAGILGYGL